MTVLAFFPLLATRKQQGASPPEAGASIAHQGSECHSALQVVSHDNVRAAHALKKCNACRSTERVDREVLKREMPAYKGKDLRLDGEQFYQGLCETCRNQRPSGPDLLCDGNPMVIRGSRHFVPLACTG